VVHATNWGGSAPLAIDLRRLEAGFQLQSF
jgi:hypothetical protein